MSEFNPDQYLSGEGFDPDQYLSSKQKENYLGSGVIEPVRAVASSIGRDIVGGLGGLVQSVNPFAEAGAGAKFVEDLRAGAFKPETPEGKENLSLFGELVQKGVDIVNFPISGLMGLSDLISGEGIDKAVDTIKKTQEEGFGKTLGDRAFEENGDPLNATIGAVFPDFVMSLTGGRALSKAPQFVEDVAKNIPDAISTGLDVTKKATAPVVQGVKDISKGVFEFQTPTRQKIAKLLAEGSEDVSTAGFKLAPSAETSTGIQAFFESNGPKAIPDNLERSAIKQGFDPGVISAIKNISPLDRKKLISMVDNMEKGKKNKRFAQLNRPSDIAGDTLMDTFRQVTTANARAGEQIERVSKSLQGKDVDFTPAIDAFLSDLSGLGVTLSATNKPNFKMSDIEGVAPAERLVTQVINRMKSIENPDGLALHKLKRFIDEQVSFGKAGEGLTGRTEGVLKKLRRNIDKALDDKFPEYNKVNTVYSETIGAIDSLQGAIGKKIDLTSPNSEKAMGTILRRLMGNQVSRVSLMDSIQELDRASKAFGGGDLPKIEGAVPLELSGGSDLLTQILFFDELDRVFGPVARTSFQGQIDQALKQGVNAATTKAGAIDLGLEALGKGIDKAKGINEAGAFEAIKKLLNKENEQ